MSTTGKADTKDVKQSYEEKVNSLLKTVTADDSGELAFPEGTSEDLIYAVRAEKKARDTRAAYTKSQQQLKVKEAENEKLLELFDSDDKYGLTPEQKAELDDLMYSDPKAWRKKANQLEEEVAENRKKKISDALSEVSESTNLEVQKEHRTRILDKFREANPELDLSEDVLKYDVPLRITKKLDSGEITYEDYLEEAKVFLAKGKSVMKTKAPDEPSLGKLGGDNNPTTGKKREINWQDV